MNAFVDGFLLPFTSIWRFFGALDRLGGRAAGWLLP